MKVTIDIPDEEIREEVKRILTGQIAKRMYGEWIGEGYVYHRAIKDVIRELIRQNLDDLSDRAVYAAAKTISNKGIKKLLEDMQNG